MSSEIFQNKFWGAIRRSICIKDAAEGVRIREIRKKKKPYSGSYEKHFLLRFCQSFISFCSRWSFQGYLDSPQPWKTACLLLSQRANLFPVQENEKNISLWGKDEARFARSSLQRIGFPKLCFLPCLWHTTTKSAASTTGLKGTSVNMKIMLPAKPWVTKTSVWLRVLVSSVNIHATVGV